MVVTTVDSRLMKDVEVDGGWVNESGRVGLGWLGEGC